MHTEGGEGKGGGRGAPRFIILSSSEGVFVECAQRSNPEKSVGRRETQHAPPTHPCGHAPTLGRA